MNEWKEVELGDLVHIKHGWAFKGKYFAEDGDVIVVTPGNFLEEGGFRVREGKEKFYTDDFPKEFLLKKDDLIIAMTEQGAGLLGSPALITEDNRFLHNQRIGLFQNLKEDQISKKYMYYLFFTQYIRGMISGSATGTKVKHTAPKRIYNIKVKLPPLLIQKKIAKILSNYDDLIENNLKRIKLLEESARLTYEEWFLRFIIDGKKLEIDSETGLPFGWKEKRIKDFGQVVTGKTPSTSNDEYYNGDVPFVKTPSMHQYSYVLETDDYLTEKGASTQNNKFLKKNSLMVSCIGSAGVYALVAKDCQTNQQINSIKFFKKEYTFYMYGFSQSFKIILEALGSNGATMTNVNKTKFENIKVVMPDILILEKYHKEVEPKFETILNLLEQNQLLKEARDILLPRLMTGMIDVDELEVAV